MNDKKSRSGTLFRVVVVMAIVWSSSISSIAGHHNPYFSLPKKIAFCLSAMLILSSLLFTGTGKARWGCAVLFLFGAMCSIGAMWVR
jgi:hypothetical protein